jgi:Icc-related predicted phosphoesterase
MDWAFNGPRDSVLAKKFFDNLYSSIPADTDIVVSHGPPQGILDNGLGCASLRHYVDRIRPHACIFGHIHEGYGTKRVDNTIFANASVLDVKYNLVNTPIVFSIDIQKKQ